ncbi:MAG: hypothetical protein J5720_08770 [Bacteroidaceae bacterium]|nr:hypothetical protein [Bacteroidaceae bacterium]
MKKFVLIIAVCSVLLPLDVHAQFVRLEKYPDIPVEFEAAFVDQVTNYVSGVVKSLYGQYFGQLSPEGNIYGYGSFYTDMDGEVYGLYRNGDLAFGIKKGAEIAKVGTNEHYVAYDLRTGYPVYIMKNNQKYNPSTDMREKNKFMVMTYPNGDKYVGETCDNKREGYGLYFYSNGNFYYGKYKDNKQFGYGALFKQENNNVTIQYWDESSDED